MSVLSPRGLLALASTLTVGATALVAFPPAAGASLPGSGNVLTISAGGTSVQVINGSTRSTLTNPDGEAMRDISWSPDGSRLIYLAPDRKIKSLRYTGADTVKEVHYFAPADAERAGTSWLGDGSGVVWGEKWGSSEYDRWKIRVAPSTWNGWGETISPPDYKHYRNPDGGPGRLVVFQAEDDDGTGRPTGQPAVMLWDGSKPELSRVTLVDPHGSNPALSPDGRRVAFVRDGRIVVSDLKGDNEVTLTPTTPPADNPTWSPDGWTIAYSQQNAVATVEASSWGATPRVVSTSAGVPAYQPRRTDRVVRLAGTNRFLTATKASQSHWATAADTTDRRERAGAVVISRSDLFADALAGSALAGAKRGPLLLTPPTYLQTNTADELRRVLAPGGRVYLLGSPGALATSVEDAIRGLGYDVRRLAGPDRYATAVEIAKEMRGDGGGSVFLATGTNFPDALAAGAAAGQLYDFAPIPHGVVLLTKDAVMPAATKAYLDSLSSRTIFAVGRSAAAAAEAYDDESHSIVGTDRYDTARQVARIFFESPRHTGLATGTDWPDALAGGALMATLGGPLLLTPGTARDLGPFARDALDETSGAVHTGLLFGSAPVLSDTQMAQAGTWLGGPLGATSVVNPTDIGLPGARVTGEPTVDGRQLDERIAAETKALTARATR